MEPIPGRPLVLVVGDKGDGLAAPLVASLRRRGVAVHPDSPWRSDDGRPRSASSPAANCVVAIGVGAGATLPSLPIYSPGLLIVGGDAAIESHVSSERFATVVRVSAPGLPDRALMLFLAKFLYELDLHSADAITPEMLRFAHFKALRIARRRYPELASELYHA